MKRGFNILISAAIFLGCLHAIFWGCSPANSASTEKTHNDAEDLNENAMLHNHSAVMRGSDKFGFKAQSESAVKVQEESKTISVAGEFSKPQTAPEVDLTQHEGDIIYEVKPNGAKFLLRTMLRAFDDACVVAFRIDDDSKDEYFNVRTGSLEKSKVIIKDIDTTDIMTFLFLHRILVTGSSIFRHMSGKMMIS